MDSLHIGPGAPSEEWGCGKGGEKCEGRVAYSFAKGWASSEVLAVRDPSLVFREEREETQTPFGGQ